MVETKFKHTEIGLIPYDWEVKTIKEFADITTGSQNTQDHVDDGKYPFFVRSPKVERINKYIFDTEGVVTAGDGVGTGKIYHYINGKFGLHQRCYLMYNFADVSAKYFYWIFSRNFYDRVQSMTAKSSVDSVRMEMIADMSIPLPPTLAEQERIAGALSSIDTLIGALNEQIEKKRHIKQGTMQQLLTGKKRLAGFTGEWISVKLEKIATITIGEFVHKNKQNPNGLYPVYNGGVTETGYYDDYNNTANKIVISARGAAGFINKVEIPYWAGNSSYSIGVFDTNFDWIYVYYFMKSKEETLTGNRQQGGGVPAVNKNQITEFNIWAPSTIAEQSTIAAVLSGMDTEIAALEQKRDKYIAIKSGMMQQLLTGKIRLI